MKVVLPVAGKGARYEPLTRWLPKCLAPVRQRPLIAWAVDALDVPPHHLVIVANERDRALLDPALDALFGRTCIRVWTQDTGGAPQTVLRAREHIENNDELLIVTPDLVWSADLALLRALRADAGLVVTTRQWEEPAELQRNYSYCRTAPDGRVTEVVEKPLVPLTLANVGAYWWAEGRQFVRFATAYLRAGETVRGESYIAPIYNHAMRAGLNVRTVLADTYVNLGSAQRAARWEGWGE